MGSRQAWRLLQGERESSPVSANLSATRLPAKSTRPGASSILWPCVPYRSQNNRLRTQFPVVKPRGGTVPVAVRDRFGAYSAPRLSVSVGSGLLSGRATRSAKAESGSNRLGANYERRQISMSARRAAGDISKSRWPSRREPITVVAPGAWSLKSTSHSGGQAGNRNKRRPALCKSMACRVAFSTPPWH